jgi:hydrogenase maturation protein HypF
MSLERLRILITGQVQGVGFRPHAYRIARQLGLIGWVQNNASGVLIEIQGQSTSHFLPQLMINLPPLARIDDIQMKVIPPKNNEKLFQIVESTTGSIKTIISPDMGICPACLHELFDPNSRYYLYPFLNCTHCGPRLSITRRLPYDRRQTSMDVFPLCGECQHDYGDPTNRRYHAQPTACANCGPQLALFIAELAKYILDGEIIALKGLGGYQLICDAKNKHALLKLRERKNRESKPFALMVANIISANAIAELNECSEKLLLSKERPIVLLPKKDKLSIDDIAPGLSYYGVMLPYTPLHYLLFHALAGDPYTDKWINEFDPSVLIVTSANSGGDPLIIDDQVAQRELHQIADKIVSYNREIVCRVDDSVVHVINKAPVFIRRARGFVPTSIKLPHAIPSTLAVGGHLKNTFCLTRDDQAFVSQHIGSLNNKASIEFFHESLNHFIAFLGVKPERIAHDLHPDFYTTRFALSYGMPAYAVQHHHAHLAAVAAEHHVQEPSLGLALDGYGYGTNGEAWGGELLLLENTTFERLGSFYPLPQPGGDIAAREPWRMAASVMHVLGRGHEIPTRLRDYPHAGLLPQLLEKRLNTPLTSSCGRLFDAASSLLGVTRISQYEGQAAMQLESLVTRPEMLPKGWRKEEGYFNMLPTLAHLFDMDPIKGANLFHGTLIAGLAEWVLEAAERLSIDVILLGGGCFLNKVLTEGLIKILAKNGLKTLLSQKLPPNDGGISLGQAWIAGRM